MPGYPIPADRPETITEIKKSRFIARAAHVADRGQVKAFLAQMRSDYPDARHHCWAYLLGDPAGSCDAAMNDDGEPSGTAGKPILNVIQHKGVGDVMVVVARYFGGIKLGAGGLVRAYSSSAEAVMSVLRLTRYEPLVESHLLLDFSREQLVRHWAGQHGAEVLETRYSQQVLMTLQLSQTQLPALLRFCRETGVECTDATR